MLNEFIQIHSLLSPKNMVVVTYSQLVEIRPSSVKIWRIPLGREGTLFILLGSDDNQVLLKYLYIFMFCSGTVEYIDNDNIQIMTIYR